MTIYKRIIDLGPGGRALADSDYLEGDTLGSAESKRYTGAQVRAVEKGERIAADNALAGKVGLGNQPGFNLPDLSGTNYLGSIATVIQGLIILDQLVNETLFAEVFALIEMGSEDDFTWDLQDEVLKPNLTQLYINGHKQSYPSDFTISGSVITWVSPFFNPETTDKIEVYFKTHITNNHGPNQS